jgi:hypothetical protein
MNEVPEAEEITLRKLRPTAPSFHRHIARSKLLGKPTKVGDRIVVYEVVVTVPDGLVLTTEKTIIHFE